MTAFRVRILLACFATGAVLGQSFTVHAADVDGLVSVCFALREGASLAAVERAVEEQGYSAADAGWVVGLQVRDHCPDQKGRVLAEAREALR